MRPFSINLRGRAGIARKAARRKRRPGKPAMQRTHRLGVEALEDRRLLAIVTVDTTSDVDDGNTSSISALISDPGEDGAGEGYPD